MKAKPVYEASFGRSTSFQIYSGKHRQAILSKIDGMLDSMIRQITPSIELILTDIALYAIDKQEIDLLESAVRDMEIQILDTLQSVLKTERLPWIVLDLFESKGCRFRLRISGSRVGSGNDEAESRVANLGDYSAGVFRVFTIGKPTILQIGELRIHLPSPSA
jgi:hypothetical protein